MAEAVVRGLSGKAEATSGLCVLVGGRVLDLLGERLLLIVNFIYRISFATVDDHLSVLARVQLECGVLGIGWSNDPDSVDRTDRVPLLRRHFASSHRS